MAYHLHPDYDTKQKKDDNIDEYYEYDVALIQLEKSVIASTEIR